MLFIILSNFLAIYNIQFVGKSVDIIQQTLVHADVEKHKLFKILFRNAAIIVICSFLAGFFQFMMRQTIIVASRKIEYDLKNKVYSHYQTLSLTLFKKTTIGDLLNRLSEDVVAVRMYLGPGVMYIANMLVLLSITVVYMLTTDVRMTLWTLLPLPFLSLAVYKVSSIISRKSKTMQNSQSEISTFVQDSFSGIRVIKFFGKEEYIKRNYNHRVKTYMLKALDLARTESYFFTIILFIIGMLNVVILYVGGEQYINGKTPVGTIADFFMYVNILIWPFSSVGYITSINQRAEASMERINEFLDMKTEIVNKNLEKYPVLGKIEFRNVSYTYPNTGIQALENVSFTIKSGESMAIMGKTGSGKTTIALLICRLIDPDQGQILIDGVDLKNHNLDWVRRSIGFIPQESYLFSDTVANNIGLALDHPEDDRIQKFAKIADVHKNIVKFRDQYETMVGERGVMLSGGQKQRISIARALIHQPRIILFDDSLSALDTETEDNILRNVNLEIKGATQLIITHRESSAKNADAILYLNDGRVTDYVRLK